MNLLTHFYKIIRWLPVPKTIKFRWTRDYMDWHWRRDIAKAEKKLGSQGVNQDHIERGHQDWQYEMALHYEDEKDYYSKKLLRRANHLRVSVPRRYEGMHLTEYYEESHFDHRIFLSTKGEQVVRAAIREEEEHRSKQVLRWLPIITALTGLAGAVGGLVALLDKLG